MFIGGSMVKLLSRVSFKNHKVFSKADDAVAVTASFVKRNDRLSHKMDFDLVYCQLL